MRSDLAQFVPAVAANNLLMCCACGRFLPQDDFDLEHLIPQQALKLDPSAVRMDPSTPANVRARNLLLCKKPLKYKGNFLYGNGCNSWKGRHYDKAIRELVTGVTFRGASQHGVIIAALSLAYLAMVSQFGYQIVLLPSGLLMREQFFNPTRFMPALPIMSQMVLGTRDPIKDISAPMWKDPFSFGLRDGACDVAIRGFCIALPLARDPRIPIVRHLEIVPRRYKLRPDFRTSLS